MDAKAKKLLALGFHIFPCSKDKLPLTEHSHLDASNDPAQVELWSKAYPSALWGVHAGRSGVVVLDIDVKGGKNGYITIEDEWLNVPETFKYFTQSKGEHFVYQAPDGILLNGQSNYRKYEGVDRRGGSSYFIFWGEPPATRNDFLTPPEWLLDEASVRTGSEYLGQLDDWLSQLEEGEPTETVINAIERFPEGDISHSQMIERQMELIRLGAERHPGVGAALEILRDQWLNRDPSLHGTPEADWGFKFDEALYGGISKFGATSQLLLHLPDYSETLEKLPDSFSLDMVFGSLEPKKHYHTLLESLIRTDLNDEEIVSIMWNAPTVKQHTVEWGEAYLVKQIREKRKSVPEITDGEVLDLPEQVTEEPFISLLTKYEREILQHSHTWIDLYIDWAETRLTYVNKEYHIANGLTLMEAFACPVAHFQLGNKDMPLNLYKMALGESSTGKTDAIKLREKVEKTFLFADPTYKVGTDVSKSALHANLLDRDNQWSLSGSGEVAAFFKTILDPRVGAWASTIDTFLTDVYDGEVPPMPRMANRKESAGKTAHSLLTAMFMGTPKKVFELLNGDMFEDGFLARFLWFFGEGYNDEIGESEDEEEFTREGATESGEDEEATQIGASLIGVYRGLNHNGFMEATSGASSRFAIAKREIFNVIKAHDRSELLHPSSRRLLDSIKKIAALFALSEQSGTIYEIHMLQAIQLGELLLNNAVKATYQVSSTMFQRGLDDMYSWIYSKGGNVRHTDLAKAFAGKLGRDYRLHVETLRDQGLIKTSEDEKGAAYFTVVT